LMGEGSSIVIICSTSSVNPGPGMSVYVAIKAALRALVRSWILDMKGVELCQWRRALRRRRGLPGLNGQKWPIRPTLIFHGTPTMR
jgi:hypothetical protein